MSNTLQFTLTVDQAEIPPMSSPVQVAPYRSPRHRVIDFHFGCARGVGFSHTADSGIIPFTLSAPASKGALSFGYTGNAPAAAQLIVLLGTDGNYYTAVGLSLAGGVCNLCDPLPCDVAAGQNAWSFWDNNAHPNAHGYKAIIDHALRQDFAPWRKVYAAAPSVSSPATIAACASNSVINPGSASSGNGWTVTPSGAGGGASWTFTPAKADTYRLVFECSKSAEGSADIDLAIISGGVTLKTYAIKSLSPVRHEVDFYAPGAVTIKMTRSAGVFFTSGMSVLARDEQPLSTVDFGRHMVLGDSWVFDPVGIAARLTERLENAEVVKSGVGGNRASDLIARFDADVAAVGPFDFVWGMVGTNDIAQGVTAATFSANLAVLINKIQGIGATPIIFTPYPGCTDILARVDLSRVYMASVPYYPT